ncbi:ATP-dependent helicase HrpB [Ancylobacter dichloromethanicus]|uniref:ATP-dependent helicase n=1 Tax=Ancylobacter dichloromethanicus TaxID=518825 RepID=A0A9W6JBT9_9HYPH|nr:ATP-dependent helicase HrpB [Ancylobacter dichloromethanicus]MBS7553451.1 ATP-dependent helicase HrpB [Ancylobacter dichloromethanicus]GLK74372.1 ATP-dependent helicase [Ancylobacter dichloromethanicus]
MAAPLSPLPIDDALPALTAALRAGNAAVLVAPPGAGKTTRVPLALLDEPWVAGRKILVLEPRRLAARAAATRMAQTLGEAAGQTVGYRARFGSKVGRHTRIEVITEGIFTRMMLDDPELSGVAAVLFDEFHERSLDADLGLALALDAQGALREDLRILVMSATLDGARVARLLDGAPVVESLGRAFPVETRYAGRVPGAPVERQMAEVIAGTLARESGSILAFLPGAAEIRRTERFLREAIRDPAIDIAPLYGALTPAEQDRAIAPAPPGRRKVVLATSIAETSLTIEGVRVVVDSGLARVPRFEPGVGLTRLETVRVSRAAADQRRGRAGRTEPGVCLRLWHEPETASLPAFATPEILAADLSRLMLDLAVWGVRDPATMAFLDPPPAPAVKEAKALLAALGALDADGQVSEHGRAMARLPLEPRLARMVIEGARRGAGEDAARIAALVSERGLGGDALDLTHRMMDFSRDRSRRTEEAQRLAERWAGEAERQVVGTRAGGDAPSPAVLLALAFPDRIARGRGDGRRFVLANGRGAALDPASSLARARFLAIAELTGTADEARILLAAELSEAEIEAEFGTAITEGVETAFDPASGALRARHLRRLGALVLAERTAPLKPGPDTAQALAHAAAARGLERLAWSDAQRQWLDRARFLHASAPELWPDLSWATLTATVEDWLAPALGDVTALSALDADRLGRALATLLPWESARRMETEAPTHVEVPTGSRLPIDYAAEGGPTLHVRVQELFGLTTHPSIAGGRVPLVLSLLSPAHRPIQLTRDLPAFWAGSWRDVRADMRGRYPRHPWPENPAQAEPTRRAKPRG